MYWAFTLATIYKGRSSKTFRIDTKSRVYTCSLLYSFQIHVSHPYMQSIDCLKSNPCGHPPWGFFFLYETHVGFTKALTHISHYNDIDTHKKDTWRKWGLIQYSPYNGPTLGEVLENRPFLDASKRLLYIQFMIYYYEIIDNTLLQSSQPVYEV